MAAQYSDFTQDPKWQAMSAEDKYKFAQSPDMSKLTQAPDALDNLHQQQLGFANQFTQGLASMQAKAAQQLTTGANQQMNAQIKQVKNQNNARGLNYGGINQGQQQQVRSYNQQQLAGNIAGSNANLQNAANNVNAQAIETGVGMQQMQQQLQNQIFQQQWATTQANNSMVGSALGMGILGAAISDRRLKTDIEPISQQDIKELRSNLKAYKYKYVDIAHGEGDWIGVMAQDLEKSRLGKNLVFENAKGQKMIDMKKAMSLALAVILAEE